MPAPSADSIAEIVSGFIPLFAGTLISLYAYEILPRNPTNHEAWANWHDRWGRFAKIAGPLVALFGLAGMLSGAAAFL